MSCSRPTVWARAVAASVTASRADRQIVRTEIMVRGSCIDDAMYGGVCDSDSRPSSSPLAIGAQRDEGFLCELPGGRLELRNRVAGKSQHKAGQGTGTHVGVGEQPALRAR